jgi:hypothetical protein
LAENKWLAGGAMATDVDAAKHGRGLLHPTVDRGATMSEVNWGGGAMRVHLCLRPWSHNVEVVAILAGLLQVMIVTGCGQPEVTDKRAVRYVLLVASRGEQEVAEVAYEVDTTKGKTAVDDWIRTNRREFDVSARIGNNLDQLPERGLTLYFVRGRRIFWSTPLHAFIPDPEQEPGLQKAYQHSIRNFTDQQRDELERIFKDYGRVTDFDPSQYDWPS